MDVIQLSELNYYLRMKNHIGIFMMVAHVVHI